MSLPSLPSLSPAIYIAVLVSLLVAVLLVITQKWHGRFSMDSLIGIQKMHTLPTPRIGGVAIFAGVVAAWSVAEPSVAKILGALIMAGLPAFVFGLAEDLTKQVSVLARLLATMASGALGWWMTDYSLTTVDVPILDLVLGWLPASVIFTCFAVGGIANAVNIIDGFNGLASGFVVVALTGIGLLAALHGDVHLSVACLAIAASMVGFWLVNWPWGKIFLGDGGSYFGGFALAWASVLLVERNNQVTAFAALLICIHPVTEVLFSVYRRRLKKLHPGHPDRLHLHTLIMRRVVSRWLIHLNNGERKQMLNLRNPLTGIVLALISLPSTLVALWFSNAPTFAILSCLIFGLGYVTIYARIVRFRWFSPITFLFVKPHSKHKIKNQIT
jgi:UDP-N-acetylmuramyl pentapeptide phosphotransferase/UDP-N-acetylglucosamine-1-phosphate transferase